MWERARANVVGRGRGSERASEQVEGEGWTRDGKREETVETRMKDEEGGATMLERNKWRKSGKMGMR